MSGYAYEYPSAENIKTNTWLTYNKPPSWKMYLFIMPTTTFNEFGIKKPVDMVAHWAICVNGWCYELKATGNKRKPYDYRPTPEPDFVRYRDGQKKRIVYGELGYTALTYSHERIDEVAKLVWERSLKKKYAYDEYNCQVFIRLLVELIGDQNTKVKFPHFLDQWVKGAGNTRDGSFFAFAAGAVLFATGLTFMGADGGATSAAGFALAAQTTLRSTAWLLTERDNRAKKIKEGQKDIRKEMRKRGTPLAEA